MIDESKTVAAILKGTRLLTLVDAAEDVCCDCGRRSFPGDSRPLSGPNSAGNYCHRVDHPEGGFYSLLCRASVIWSRIAFEFGNVNVESESPRGWVTWVT